MGESNQRRSLEYLEPPTTLNRDVWQYVDIERHTIEEAARHFNLSESSIYRHVKKFKERMPLPDDYITLLRNRAKRLADLGLDAIEDNLLSGEPDLHTAVQVAKGTGILVEKIESEQVLYVTGEDPEKRWREVLEKVKSPHTSTPPAESEGSN